MSARPKTLTPAERARITRARKAAIIEERERIRGFMLARIEGLKTTLADDYGAGWNGALAMLELGLQRSS